MTSELTYPLAPAQREIILHDELIETPIYNLLAAVRIDGPVDPDRLISALAIIGDRHAALRARVVLTEDLCQSVAAPGSAPPPLWSRRIDPTRLDEEIRDFVRTPLDLFSEPPIRACLFLDADGGEAQALALVVHHAFADGFSMRLLCEELSHAYGGPEPSADDRTGDDFGEYLDGLRAAGAGSGDQLSGAGGDQPDILSGRGVMRLLQLSAAQTKRLRGRAQELGTTPFVIALAAFASAVAEAGDFPFVRLSTPVSTRLSGTSPSTTVGPFMRMASLSVFPSAASDDVLVRRTHRAVARATSPQEEGWQAPEETSVPSGLAFGADTDPGQFLRLTGCATESLAIETGFAVFGLLGTLEGWSSGDLRLRIDAAEEVLAPDEAEALLRATGDALELLIADPTAAFSPAEAP